MLRTSLAKSFIKRTIRPNYGWTQATPKSGFLDAAWDRSVPIWPGMAMMKTLGAGGPNFTLINGTGVVHGLCAHYIGGDGIDELTDAGINAMAVWVMDPDAEFEILAPAFDANLTWTDAGTGVEQFVYARTANLGVVNGLNGNGGPLGTNGLRGQLVTTTDANKSAQPVARLISVNSSTSITIGGLAARSGAWAV